MILRGGSEHSCCALIWPRLQPRHLGMHPILRPGSIGRLEQADDYSIDPEQSHKVNDQTYKNPEKTLTYHNHNLTLPLHHFRTLYQHFTNQHLHHIQNAVLQHLSAEHGSLRLCHNHLQLICRRGYYVLCFLAWSRQCCENFFDCRIDHERQKLQLEGCRRSYWNPRSCCWRRIGSSCLGLPRIVAH
jgi:transcriptional antiterminator